MEKDKTPEQIINEKIDSNNEIGFLWSVYYLSQSSKKDRISDYINFINNKERRDSKMEGYINFLDDCFDKYNYYLKEKRWDKRTAEFYAIKGSIKKAKDEKSERIRREQRYQY